MFGIDGIEFLVIILVAILVIGPEDMPKMLRAFVRVMARVRALTQEFRGHFDDAMRQADMQESMDSLREIGNSVRGLDPRRKLREFYATLEEQPQENLPVKKEFDCETKIQPAGKVLNETTWQGQGAVCEHSIDIEAREAVENTPKALRGAKERIAIKEDVSVLPAEPVKSKDTA